MENLVIVLIMFIATLGPAFVIGWIGKASITALGRNPSAAPKILMSMIIAFIFAESIAIIALLVVFSVFH
ncbi:MAG: ATP synthase F0 subunit C [bacterium]